jgi:Holliday junction resolvase RusA-like endonuclease
MDFALQVPPEARRNMGALNQPLRSIVTVYYPSWQQDLDCAIVYDMLQKCGVVANDRYIREHYEYAEVDPKNPRVELTVEFI